MSILVRLAAGEDVPAIVGIRCRVWHDTYPNERHGITVEDIESLHFAAPRIYERWCRRVESPGLGHRTWVAERKGTVLGFLHAYDANGPWINSLDVDPPARRTGVGRALLEEALDHFGLGASVGLQVVAYNDRAIAFYRAMGFFPSGEAVPPVAPFPSGRPMPMLRMRRPPVM